MGKMVAPASEASCILRRWMRLKGVSRTQRIRGAVFFECNVGGAMDEVVARPLAMCARVPMEQGRTIMAAVG